MAATLLFQVSNAGANIVLDGSLIADQTLIQIYAPPNVVLAADWHLEVSPEPPVGTRINYMIALNSNMNLNGNTFDIDSASFSQYLITNVGAFVGFKYYGPGGLGGLFITADSVFSGYVNAANLGDGAVTLAKLENLTSANLIVGNGSNIPTAVAMSGDVTMTNAGVTSIGAGVVVDADVNASAAIARTKLASGTASYIVANDGSGVMTDQQYVTKAQGGFGQNVAAATGFTTFSSGTLSIDAIAEVVTLQVSWETGFVGDFKVKMPFAGTVTEIYAFLDKAIGALDATVTPKNNSGTTMSSGVLTFTASDPKGTAQTSSPSANNTFVATDVLTFTTAGGSAAGVATLSIKVTRTS